MPVLATTSEVGRATSKLTAAAIILLATTACNCAQPAAGAAAGARNGAVGGATHKVYNLTVIPPCLLYNRPILLPRDG